jgi:class 3 adenylate cyclase
MRRFAHIPRILCEEIGRKFYSLEDQRIESDSFEDEDKKAGVCRESLVPITVVDCDPYIFNAVFMVVDISGFTSLSNAVGVDDFQSIVNSYFASVIDIVDAYEGDVVKFAGDALQIIWKLEMFDDNDMDFTRSNGCNNCIDCGSSENSARDSRIGESELPNIFPIDEDSISSRNSSKKSFLMQTSRALSCARMIHRKCHNTQVIASASFSRLWFPDAVGVEMSEATAEKTTAYTLQVHTGISVSELAGISVADNERREYFVVGEAVRETGKALEAAGPGDIVISQKLHSLMMANGAAVGHVNCSCTDLSSGLVLYSDDVSFDEGMIEKASDEAESSSVIGPESLKAIEIIAEYAHEIVRLNADNRGNANSLCRAECVCLLTSIYYPL